MQRLDVMMVQCDDPASVVAEVKEHAAIKHE
jgi:hypothetical protein